jgi:uncharacterized protein (DUF4415 family)
MTVKKRVLTDGCEDEDLPEWTDEHFQRAAIYDGDRLVRPASGTFTKPGRPKSADPKQQVTLRLDSIVLDKFRAMGPRWQSRINAELRKALGL